MGGFVDMDIKAPVVTVRQDQSKASKDERRTVRMSEVEKHNRPDDCWVVFHDEVYDVTEFAKTHPGGSELITRLAGTDGTAAFSDMHDVSMLARFDDKVDLGFAQRAVRMSEVEKHNTPDDCWV